MKRRKFFLGQILLKVQATHIQHRLALLVGIRAVHIEGAYLYIDYDSLEVTSQQIEAALYETGVSLGSHWGERLKLGWIHYIEDNALNSLSLDDPVCCHTSPR